MSDSILELQNRPIESLKPAEYHSLSRDLLSSDALNLSRLRFAALSSFSFSLLDSYMVVEAARKGIHLLTWFGPFGQIEQPLLDTQSSLWTHNPEFLAIALRIEDCYPDAFFRLQKQDQLTLLDCARECIARLLAGVKLFRQHSDAPILLANFAAPFREVTSRLFDASDAGGAAHDVATANHELAEATSNLVGVYLWDYAGLVSERGRAAWTDARMWHLARQPISTSEQPYAAAHLAQSISAVLRPPAKCLVLDFDNTLWGGVVADDGIEGIAVGDDYPGNAFKSFQRCILSLMDRGVLIAAASKNDEAVAQAVFERHSDMLLEWSDFSATRVNWNRKSDSLMEIADELNIGLDSLVLFDDNPVERQEVKLNVPDVKVIDVPLSSVNYSDALIASGFFESPNRTIEDLNRTRFYREEKLRSQSRNRICSMAEYLDSLNMVAEFGMVSPETLARVAQLILKTNQFNLTTRRHSQAKIDQMAKAADWEVRWIRLSDRFGDSGLVGATIVQYENTIAHIESFVMSCRVMNRNVEKSMVHDIVKLAHQRGCTVVTGEWIPTERNAIAKNLFSDCGFMPVNQDSPERNLFGLEIADKSSFLAWSDSLERIR